MVFRDIPLLGSYSKPKNLWEDRRITGIGLLAPRFLGTLMGGGLVEFRCSDELFALQRNVAWLCGLASPPRNYRVDMSYYLVFASPCMWITCEERFRRSYASGACTSAKFFSVHARSCPTSVWNQITRLSNSSVRLLLRPRRQKSAL